MGTVVVWGTGGSQPVVPRPASRSVVGIAVSDAEDAAAATGDLVGLVRLLREATRRIDALLTTGQPEGVDVVELDQAGHSIQLALLDLELCLARSVERGSRERGSDDAGGCLAIRVEHRI